MKDYGIPLIAIIASILAAFMSFITSISQNTLQNDIAKFQEEQAKKEFRLNVYIKSYDLVEKALEDKNAPAGEFARRVISLVEDDDVKQGLLDYLKLMLQKVKEEQSKSGIAQEDLELVIARAEADQEVLTAQTQPSSSNVNNENAPPDLHGWRIQVMYCERQREALENATTVAKTIASYTGAKCRLTSVSPNSENKVSNSPININYSKKDNGERKKAEALAEFLNSQGLSKEEFKLRKVNTDFGDHMSVYVCP